MNHRQTVSLWILVERLESVAAEMELPPLKWMMLCHRLMPEWYAEPPQGAESVAEPGSESKILAMQARAAAGCSIFHDRDKVKELRDIRPDCIPEPQADEEEGLWD